MQNSTGYNSTVQQIAELLEGLPETFNATLLEELQKKRFSILQRERARFIMEHPFGTGSKLCPDKGNMCFPKAFR